MKPQINIVVPLYNEEEVLHLLISRLNDVVAQSELSIVVVLIDDGSDDNTPNIIADLALGNEIYHSIILSRNFGHPMALSAGLKFADATEGVFIIDGDLQDPPELLMEYYQKLKSGYDVVYGIRKKRKENLFKRTAYKFFYRILRKISKIEIPLDSGDFSLVSARVVKHINAMPEESRFLRGMRSWVGFRQIGIEYDRDERALGSSKYSFKKLIELAFNGIFNFSEYPIKFIMALGVSTIILSGLYFIYTLIMNVFYGQVPRGFTALLFVIILFGGIQLISIGLIGGYVIKIFFQVKNRPLFIVKERIFKKEKKTE